MENRDKTLDSPSNQRPQSGADSDPVWAQLTWEYLNDLPEQLDKISTTLKVKDYSTIKQRHFRNVPS